jgi:hypothetical protein
MSLEDSGLDIITGLTHHTTIVVSNGSFQDTYSTVAVIIEGPGKVNRLINTVIAPGGSDEMSSYRAELAGICVIIME